MLLTRLINSRLTRSDEGACFSYTQPTGIQRQPRSNTLVGLRFSSFV